MKEDWKDALSALRANLDDPKDDDNSGITIEEVKPKYLQKESLYVVTDRKGRNGKTATIIEGFTIQKEEVEEILAQTMDGTEIKIRFDVADLTLSSAKHRFITNSLKECLANGMRHGGANAFYVELSEEGEWVTLTVSDNGSGLPSDFKEGYGLKGIREKALQFGGGIVYASEPDDGCEIKIRIKSDDADGGER